MMQGADLPLKTPEEIDSFCEKTAGKYFINFRNNGFQLMAKRMGCKHFFVDNKYYRTSKGIQYLDKAIAKVQMPFNKNRKFYFHSTLFSISRPFTEYFIQQEHIAEKNYKYSLLAEESLMGTILSNSEYKNCCEINIDTRLIDWERNQGSSPHTFTIDDYQMLVNAIHIEHILFARKFSEIKDREIIDRILNELLARKKAF